MTATTSTGKHSFKWYLVLFILTRENSCFSFYLSVQIFFKPNYLHAQLSQSVHRLLNAKYLNNWPRSHPHPFNSSRLHPFPQRLSEYLHILPSLVRLEVQVRASDEGPGPHQEAAQPAARGRPRAADGPQETAWKEGRKQCLLRLQRWNSRASNRSPGMVPMNGFYSRIKIGILTFPGESNFGHLNSTLIRLWLDS